MFKTPKKTIEESYLTGNILSVSHFTNNKADALTEPLQ